MYTNPHEEAVSLQELAKNDLKIHTEQTGQALLKEALSIPPSEVWKVNKELREMGSINDPNHPEVFIDTRETQSLQMVNGRQKITIGECPVGVVASGGHYTNWWSWSTEGSARYLYSGRPAETKPNAVELYPAGLKFLWRGIFG